MSDFVWATTEENSDRTCHKRHRRDPIITRSSSGYIVTSKLSLV